MAAAAPAGSGALPKRTYFAYGIAAFSTMLISQPISMYLPQVYAKELGISLGALGAVLVATQIIDAISQQVVGYLSDRTRTRWGARKPWIAVGATLAIIASFFLLRPPPGVGIVWFLCWKLVYDFAWTAKGVAYSAWGAELTGDYKERSQIVGTAGFLGQIGNVLNDLLPIVVFGLGLVASSAYSMEVMGYYFIVGLVAIPVCHGIALFFAPQGVQQPQERPNLLGMVGAVKANKPFWRYLTAYMLSGLGLGALSLNFTFYDGFLGVGAWFPGMMTVFSITTVLVIPFWVWFANKFGKHRTYSLAMAIGAIAPLGFWVVNPMNFEKEVIIAYGTLVVTLIGVGVGANIVTTSAILGDIVDYGTLKSKTTRTAGYFAFSLLVTKVATAIGSGIAFMAVASFGYNAAAGAVNDATANLGILIVVTLVPAVLKLAAAYTMLGYPLTAKRHGVIRRRLEQRAERAAREKPIDPAILTAVTAAETTGLPNGVAPAT